MRHSYHLVSILTTGSNLCLIVNNTHQATKMATNQSRAARTSHANGISSVLLCQSPK